MVVSISHNTLNWALRRDTWTYTALTCLGLGAFIAGLALLIYVAGWVAFAVMWLIILLLYAVTFGVPLGIVVAGVSSESEKDIGAALFGGGLLALIVGGILHTVTAPAIAGLESFAGTALLVTAAWAEGIWTDIFLKYYVWAWFAVPASAMAAYTALYVLGLGVASLGPWMAMALFKATYRCDWCRNSEWPLFQCPHCNALVAGLRPTFYGMFFARCGNCDASLGTTRLTGRGKLQSVCPNPHCANHIAPDSAHVGAWHIALVGDRKAGKSSFVFAALWQMVEQIAALHGFEVRIDGSDAATYQRYAAAFMKGSTLPPTRPEDIKALSIRLTPTRSSGHTLVRRTVDLKIYDLAGESFLEDGNIVQHSFFAFADAVIFILDPFAFPHVRARLAQDGRFSDADAAPSQERPDMILDRLAKHLTRLHDGRHDRFPQPVAMVVTKGDVLKELGLGLEPGNEVPGDWTHLDNVITQAEDSSGAIRDAVARIPEAGNFVRRVELAFPNARWFCASALGRSPQRTGAGPFRPQGVALPFVWALSRARALSPERTFSYATKNLIHFIGHCLRGREGIGGFVRALFVVGATLSSVAGAAYAAWTYAGAAAYGDPMSAVPVQASPPPGTSLSAEAEQRPMVPPPPVPPAPPAAPIPPSASALDPAAEVTALITYYFQSNTEGNFLAAFQMLDEDMRRTRYHNSIDEFTKQASTIRGVRGLQIAIPKVSGGGAEVYLEMELFNGWAWSDWRLNLTLIKRDDGWKIRKIARAQ